MLRIKDFVPSFIHSFIRQKKLFNNRSNYYANCGFVLLFQNGRQRYLLSVKLDCLRKYFDKKIDSSPLSNLPPNLVHAPISAHCLNWERLTFLLLSRVDRFGEIFLISFFLCFRHIKSDKFNIINFIVYLSICESCFLFLIVKYVTQCISLILKIY